MSGRSFYLDSPAGLVPLSASYDSEGDVLYLWRGEEPTEAISFPTDDGPIVRVDPETGELVGVTLLDFGPCWSDKVRIEFDVPPIGPSEPEAPEQTTHRELVLA